MGSHNLIYWENRKEKMMVEAAKWREEQKKKVGKNKTPKTQKAKKEDGFYTWHSGFGENEEEQLLQHTPSDAEITISGNGTIRETRILCISYKKKECMYYHKLINGHFGCSACPAAQIEMRCPYCFQWFSAKIICPSRGNREGGNLELARIYGHKWGFGLYACPDCESRLRRLMRDNGFFFCETCFNWHNFEISKYSQCTFEKETQYRKPIEKRTPREIPLDPSKYSLDEMPSEETEIVLDMTFLSTNSEWIDFNLEEECVS